MARTLLALALAACIAAGGAQAATKTADATRTTRLGIADAGDLQTLLARDRNRYLDGVRSAGATWIRVGIYWSVIQRNGPRTYDWRGFDAVVRAARRRRLHVLGVLVYTPGWARPAGTPTTAPPTDVSTFGAFAYRVARHYRTRGVHAYEIWNEPNISDFWYPAPDAVRYTSLLDAAYRAIKRGDRSATVVSGGLSPYSEYGQADHGHVNPLSFLEQMYRSGARTSFDALGWHPYNFPEGLAYHPWSAWSQMAETRPSARSIMRANGDAKKRIWATEWGAPTGSSKRSVSEADQAGLVADGLEKLRTWRWAGPSFLFSFRDKGTNSGDIEDNFGLIRRDWTPKPAFAAFQRIATSRR